MKPKSLAQWVRYARGTDDIRSFGARAGVMISVISTLETGKRTNPTLSTLNGIAKASEGRCAVQLTINPKAP